MGFIGYQHGAVTQYLFLALAVVCALTAIIQIRYLRKLKILSVYLLPVLSICMCYENVILYLSDRIKEGSGAADVAKVVYSMQVPLFVLILFEVPCRLHEARSVQFFLIPFDQEKEVWRFPAALFSTTMRLLAAGAFAINLLVNFSEYCMKQLDDDHDCSLPLRSGIFTLITNTNNTMLWMALAVPVFLFVVAWNMYISLHRYGKNATLSLTSAAPWTVLGYAALCQGAGQLFGVTYYPLLSNVGEVLLLAGVSWVVYLVQKDLSITRDFAEFLHRSNLAFQHIPISEQSQQRGGPNSGLQESLHSTHAVMEAMTAVETGSSTGGARRQVEMVQCSSTSANM